MITGPLTQSAPFDLPGLHWCEARFETTDALSLHHSGLTVTLPPELLTAVPKRRAEFLAGRLCAAMALRAAGQPQTVGRKGRAPVWPSGVVGSISHGQGRVVAAVSTRLAALGVDCEAIMPDDRANLLHTELLSAQEAALRPSRLTFAAYVTLVFSGKEALYKALSSRLPQMPGFLDVTVTGITNQTMTMVLHGQTYPVQYRIDGTECLTLLALTG